MSVSDANHDQIRKFDEKVEWKIREHDAVEKKRCTGQQCSTQCLITNWVDQQVCLALTALADTTNLPTTVVECVYAGHKGNAMKYAESAHSSAMQP